MLGTLEPSYNVLKASDYKYRKMVSERLIHKLRHISRVCCERTKLTINLERHTIIEKVLRHKIVEGMQHTNRALHGPQILQKHSEEVISHHPALHNKLFFPSYQLTWRRSLKVTRSANSSSMV